MGPPQEIRTVRIGSLIFPWKRLTPLSTEDGVAFRSAYTLVRILPSLPPNPVSSCSSRLASNFNNSGNAQNPIMSSLPHLLLSLSLFPFCSIYMSCYIAYIAHATHIYTHTRAVRRLCDLHIRKSSGSRDRPPYPLLKFHPRGLATPCPVPDPIPPIPIGSAVLLEISYSGMTTRIQSPFHPRSAVPVRCPVGIFLSQPSNIFCM